MRLGLLLIIAALLLWITSLQGTVDQLRTQITHLENAAPIAEYRPMGKTQVMETCMAWYMNTDLLAAKRQICSTPRRR